MQSARVSSVGFAHAKPERAAELGTLLVSLAERAHGEQGCLQSSIHRDLAEPDLFVFYETWASKEDVERHLRQPYMKDFLARRMDYLRQDLEVRQLAPAGPATGITDPAEMNQKYLDAYNARDIDAIMAVYAPSAMAVWEPGKPVSGVEHRNAVAEFLKKEPSLRAEVRESYVADDIAALIVDWNIEVPLSPDMNGSGRGFDVLRKNAAGEWCYAITNPFGSMK